MQCNYIDFSRYARFLAHLPFLLLLLTLTSCAGSPGNHSERASDFLEVKPGEHKSLAEKTPDELVLAGKIYLENKNLELARIHFSTARNKQANNVDAHIGLGKVEMHQGKYTAALSFFKHAAEISPDSVEAFVGQAQALRFDGKLNSATEMINKALAIDPNSLMVLRELAILYDLSGQESLSEPLYKEIINRSPDVAASHNNLGMNQLVQKKYSEAILSFLQAHNINRDSIRIKNNLATAYALNGNSTQALNLFISTVGEAAAYNNLGYLYLTQGKFNEAQKALEKAISIHPKYYVKAQENISRLKQLQSNSQQEN